MVQPKLISVLVMHLNTDESWCWTGHKAWQQQDSHDDTNVMYRIILDKTTAHSFVPAVTTNKHTNRQADSLGV